MSLSVPPVSTNYTSTFTNYLTTQRPVPLPAAVPTIGAPTLPNTEGKTSDLPQEYVVKYDSSRSEIIFEEPVSPVHIGDWVILATVASTYIAVFATFLTWNHL